MKLRGLVFGWYHRKNAGDDRIAHCIERWLGDHDLTFVPHTEPPPLDLLHQCDYALIGGGSVANEVNGVFVNMARWTRAAQLPVFCVGVDISFHEAFKTELLAIPESGGMVWARSAPSAEWLGWEHDLAVGPDLTWLCPLRFDFARPDAGGPVAVNFRPWERVRWSPREWREALREFGGRAFPWPLCFGKDSDEAVLREIVGANSFPTEFDPTAASRSSLVVAARFHALVFAIQAGTPFVAVGNTKKVRFMLEQVGLERAVAPIEEPRLFRQTLERVRREVTAERLQEVTRAQHEWAWKVADRFRERIESEAAKARRRRRSLGSRVVRRVRSKITPSL
ncbi:MAG TPA: polysaccharide pyruvyl transferase family protein, partial [Pyrinomonadaceae bacterium]|nr:polysaccharide pyruvyl transferase family protein [Pyrinomonadaceae bacterium]